MSLYRYIVAIGACKFGTMQDKMLRDQIAEKSSVLCIQEQLLFKRKNNSGPRQISGNCSQPTVKAGKVIGQEDLPQHFAQALLLFASSNPPKNYAVHCFSFQPG